MAISLNQNYKCKCEHCGKEWTTKDLIVPKSCPKCRRVTWIGESASVPKLWLPYDTILAVVKEMYAEDRETLIDVFRPREQPKVADDKQTRLERARAAQESVLAGKPEEVVEEVDGVEEAWQWTKEPVWFDDTNTPYRRQWMQAGSKPKYRVCEVEEFNYDEIVRVK